MPVTIPLAPYNWPVGARLTDQRKIARADCLQNCGGRAFTNLSKGDLLIVQGGGIKHSIHAARPRRALFMLPQAISDSTPLGSFADKNNRPEILSARKYEVEFVDAGTVLFGQIVAREHQGISGTTYLQFCDLSFISR